MTDSADIISLAARRPPAAEESLEAPAAAGDTGPALRERVLEASGAAAVAVGRGALAVSRATLLIILTWLHWPVCGLLRLVGGLMILSALITWLGFRNDPEAQRHWVTLSIGVGIGCTAAHIAYDLVLGWLKPRPRIEVVETGA